MDTDTTLAWVRAVTAAVSAHTDLLTQLDAAIGDADHGTNLQRGFTAVATALESSSFDTPGEVLTKTGTTLISTVGGASGPLYGAVFRAMGKRLAGEASVTPQDLAEALRAGLEAVQKLGAAQPGDKTLIDAYAPALEAFEDAVRNGGDLPGAARAAAGSAEEGMRATVPMVARKGRASYLGPRSQGHQDPGATSTSLIFGALAETVSR
ncbi:dihydroxyacetone kinase subunit DhaL [Sphaerisporangium fuscum]|uniref:dihydroxyacetone kinase subunit DhaL n=1 Tax=Sphaerisporangium fuscum TaxID=2835868 RepID=UPI001BDC3148|nr:dihydroxyacetone kinase subunit DhaL [Sphaerisporangium fuscum]